MLKKSASRIFTKWVRLSDFKVSDTYYPMYLLLKAKWVQVNINQDTFTCNCVKPTKLDIMFRVDKSDEIQFEKI